MKLLNETTRQQLPPPHLREGKRAKACASHSLESAEHPVLAYAVPKPHDLAKYTVSISRGNYLELADDGYITDEVEWAQFVQTKDKKILRDNLFSLSPIVWTGGYRNSEAFESADWVGLDFDEGTPTLTEAISLFASFDGLVYTTKSHQRMKNEAPPCDRFRVFIGLDRTITTLDEWQRLYAALLNIFPTADKSGGDGARHFYGGRPDAVVKLLKGACVLCADSLIAHADKLGITCATTKTKTANVVVNVGQSNPTLRRSLNRWLRAKEQEEGWNDRDTHNQFFITAVNAFRFCPVPDLVAGTLLGYDWIREWLQRHPHQNASYATQIAKAFNVAMSEVAPYHAIQPKNPVHVLSASDLPLLSTDHLYMVKRYRGANGYRHTPAKQATHQLMAHVLKTEDRAIIAAPCGFEKTAAMRCYVAAHASPESRFLIVKQTRKDCREERDELKKVMKKWRTKVGLLSGFDPEQCNDLRMANPPCRSERDWPEMYSDTSPCRNCPMTSDCDVGESLLHGDKELSKPVCIITHNRFLALVEALDVPEDMTVIIDEALAHYEGYHLTKGKQDILMGILRGKASVAVAAWLRETQARVADGGAYRNYGFSHALDLCDFDGVMKKAHVDRANGGLSDEHFEVLSEFYSFFRHYGAAAMRWVMEDDGLAFIRSVVDLDIPNRMLILDGSALLSPVEWSGFRIFSLTDHRVTYPNVALYALPHNPTRRMLKEHIHQFERQVSSLLRENPQAQVLLCRNKTNADDEVEAVLAKVRSRPNVIELTRGSITGSNKARDCSVCIIAMSLFTRVSDYVLRTCVANQEDEIQPERIWRTFKDKSRKPCMKSNGGFEDEDINATYMRQTIDELYQTALRGVIRRDSNAKYSVVAFVGGYGSLIEMESLLPGFQVTCCAHVKSRTAGVFEGFMKLRDAVAKNVLPKGVTSFAKLAEFAGMSGKNGTDIEAIRRAFAALKQL